MMDADNNVRQAAGVCHELDAAVAGNLTAYMTEVIRAFAIGDAAMLESLSHDGGDPRAGRTRASSTNP